MSAWGIDIDRLHIAVHGVSSLVVEQALAGLEDELRRRLGSMRGGWEASAVPALRVGSLDLPPGADAAALRQLIAQRLLESLLRSSGPDSAEAD